MRWLRELSARIVVGVMVAMLTALGLAFWAWLKALDPFFIVIIFLAVMAIVIIIINQLDAFFQRRKRGLSKYSDKEIENAIREWIDIPGFTFKRSDAEDEDSFFLFHVVDDCDRPVHIRRSKKASSHILLWSDISIPSKSEEMQIEFAQEDLKKLAGALSLEMLRLGCGYELKDFSERGFLFRIYHTIAIDDSLTADTFKDAGAQLMRAFTLVMGIVGLTLQGMGVNVPIFRKASPQT